MFKMVFRGAFGLLVRNSFWGVLHKTGSERHLKSGFFFGRSLTVVQCLLLGVDADVSGSAIFSLVRDLLISRVNSVMAVELFSEFIDLEKMECLASKNESAET
jgi:hypothetical protein